MEAPDSAMARAPGSRLNPSSAPLSNSGDFKTYTFQKALIFSVLRI